MNALKTSDAKRGRGHSPCRCHHRSSRGLSRRREQIGLAPSDIAAMATSGPGAGTSGVAGIETTVLRAIRRAAYTIALRVPAQCTPGSLS